MIHSSYQAPEDSLINSPKDTTNKIKDCRIFYYKLKIIELFVKLDKEVKRVIVSHFKISTLVCTHYFSC